MGTGLNIKKIREYKKVSQEQLSKVSNVPRTSLGRYEREERVPNIDVLNKIATALEVDIDILINGINYEIYERNDVFNLYNQLNTQTKLSKFLGFNSEFDMEYELFKEGLSNDYNLYCKVSNFLKLNDEYLFRWYMSDFLYELFRYDDFGVNNLSREDLKFIFDNDILEKQTFDNLNSKGLSPSNEQNLKDYIQNRTLLKIDKMRNKQDYKPLGKTKKLGPLKVKKPTSNILDNLDKFELDKEHIDELKKIMLLSPVLDFYDIHSDVSDKKDFININIPSKDINKEIPISDFKNFIDKIFWGIEREIDYLKKM